MDNLLFNFTALPPFSKISADMVLPAVEKALAECRAAVEQAVQSRPVSWRSLIEATEASSDHLSRLWSPVSHFKLGGVIT